MNLQLAWNLKIFFHVHCEYEDFPGHILFELLELTHQGLTAPATRFPKLDENRHRRPFDHLVEVAIRDITDHGVVPRAVGNAFANTSS